MNGHGRSPDGKVLVVDFGAQYAQLIARRIRECNVYSEIVPHSLTAREIAKREPIGIVFSGGPSSVHSENAPSIDPDIYELGIPILGICYGAQLIAHQLEGGSVANTGLGEYGKTTAFIEKSSVLLGESLDSFQSWMSHFDCVSELPSGFSITCKTAQTPIAAFENDEKKIYGLQFHPEVKHTENGNEMFKRFLFNACGAKGVWNTESIIESETKAIKELVGDARVICGLSGGVDSAVAAALVHRAIGDQLTCIFVDTGLMRKGEAEQVESTFRKQFQIDLRHIKAEEEFLSALAGVEEPETKRKIIGEKFIRVFENEAKTLSDAPFLVQGTLYPDVIESGGSENSSTIKSHHNVGGLPDDMTMKLIEPLRNLFKDEVRALGTQLGLPDEIVYRQPFPGPGLAVRIIGEVTHERLDLVRAADAIVVEEITNAGLYRDIWQSFAVLPDVRSVGVMGDERTYEYPVVVRAVTSEDAMTADWARIPYEILEKISRRIINEVKGVNRVVYDVTSKPPGTIEWE